MMNSDAYEVEEMGIMMSVTPTDLSHVTPKPEPAFPANGGDVRTYRCAQPNFSAVEIQRYPTLSESSARFRETKVMCM